MAGGRFYEAPSGGGSRRSAPAALRNREPIARVLADWLPESGLVVEVASGSGEHALYLAERFPALDWQPSDSHPDAIASIESWRQSSDLPNLRQPIAIDSSSPRWPVEQADALLNINMVHISPWSAALGLLDNGARLLAPTAPLILYGPWLGRTIETSPGNAAFDVELKSRNPQWGLRLVEDFTSEAAARGFALVGQRSMPANNLMLLFKKEPNSKSC